MKCNRSWDENKKWKTHSLHNQLWLWQLNQCLWLVISLSLHSLWLTKLPTCYVQGFCHCQTSLTPPPNPSPVPSPHPPKKHLTHYLFSPSSHFLHCLHLLKFINRSARWWIVLFNLFLLILFCFVSPLPRLSL